MHAETHMYTYMQVIGGMYTPKFGDFWGAVYKISALSILDVQNNKKEREQKKRKKN